MRHGTVWIAHQAGTVLLETRPERGLLGGMLGFVGDGWDGMGGNSPLRVDWQNAGEVRHTFTHFHLYLSVQVAKVPFGVNPARGAFLPISQFRPSDLPTAMRKAWELAAAAFSPR